jgi:hypothetical protein
VPASVLDFCELGWKNEKDKADVDRTSRENSLAQQERAATSVQVRAPVIGAF